MWEEEEGQEFSRFNTLKVEISSQHHREGRIEIASNTEAAQASIFFSCIRHAGMQKTLLVAVVIVEGSE